MHDDDLVCPLLIPPIAVKRQEVIRAVKLGIAQIMVELLHRLMDEIAHKCLNGVAPIAIELVDVLVFVLEGAVFEGRQARVRVGRHELLEFHS